VIYQKISFIKKICSIIFVFALVMRCYNGNKNFYYMTQIFIYLLFFFLLEGLTILEFSFSFISSKSNKEQFREEVRGESKLPSLDSFLSLSQSDFFVVKKFE